MQPAEGREEPLRLVGTEDRLLTQLAPGWEVTRLTVGGIRRQNLVVVDGRVEQAAQGGKHQLN